MQILSEQKVIQVESDKQRNTYMDVEKSDVQFLTVLKYRKAQKQLKSSGQLEEVRSLKIFMYMMIGEPFHSIV